MLIKKVEIKGYNSVELSEGKDGRGNRKYIVVTVRDRRESYEVKEDTFKTLAEAEEWIKDLPRGKWSKE